LFNITAGAAAKVAFTTQPGSAAAGATIPGPPTIAVKDNFGNTVTSSTASITIAIGNNPSGGVLSGTTTKNAVAGVASFNDLSINQAGNGYTLTASSTGLTSATSDAFNVTGSSGLGIISGFVTRVSDGTPVNGALVEVFQGAITLGSASTTASGSYSIGALADGVYSVRASFTGFVPQIRSGVAISNGATVMVDITLNVGIAIHAPVAGSVINDFSVLVTGQFDTGLGEVGINVNGYVALQDANEFAALLPVDATTPNLVATVTNLMGDALATHSIPVTVQPAFSEPVLNFRPSSPIALLSQPVSLTLTSLNPISQVQLDGNGDGTVDYTGATLDGVSVTFAEPGLYFPEVTVTEPSGTLRTASALIQVLNMEQLDLLLRSKWISLKNALRGGNTASAVDYIVKSKRSNYQNVFNSLTIPFANIDQVLTNITYAGQKGLNIEYEMSRLEGADMVSYMVVFVLDEDGVWRIKFF
jgi:hypothetical protein